MRECERSTELRVIRAHMISVMDDLCEYINRLEEAGYKSEAKRLDTVIGKLYELTHKLDSKA